LVEIKVKHLKVLVKGQTVPIIDGELCEKIKVDDSFWSVEDNQFLNLNFEKATESIWKCIILGDAEIDTKKVDNSKKIDEFDVET
jgi:CS domain